MISKLRRGARRAHAGVMTFFEDIFLLLSFLLTGLQGWLLRITRPVTRHLFSRRPNPPKVKVQDIRANRIRFDIRSDLSSPFNVEVFEIEWSPLDVPKGEWNSVGWLEDIVAKTLQEPVSGGGRTSRYTWTQTPTEVVISFEVPMGLTRRDVKVELLSDHRTLLVTARLESLLDGKLYGRVQSFTNGSIWEMVKEDGKLMLNIILEKATKSQAPKWDYWRSIHPGFPELEIDTHLLTPEDTGIAQGGGMRMVEPGKMDAAQLQAMGLGKYATA